MKLKQAGFREGLMWARDGFRTFLHYPIAFAALFTLFVFASVLLLMLPLLGPLLMLVATPLVTLGFMLATERALRGRLPMPDVYIEPLKTRDKARRMALLKLGLIYAITCFLLVTALDAYDGDRLDAWWKAATSAAEGSEALHDPQLQFSLMLRFGLAALISLPFWHAPALIHWGGLPAGKAIFFSTVACWRNLSAFASFGLSWVALAGALSLVASLVFSLFDQPQLAPAALMPAVLMLATVFYVSLYFSFIGCFTADDDGAAGGGPARP